MHGALLRPFICSQRTQGLATAFSEQVSVSPKAVHILSQPSVQHVQGREAVKLTHRLKQGLLWALGRPEI